MGRGNGWAVDCVFNGPRFSATGLSLLTLPRSGRFVVVVVGGDGSLVAFDAINGSSVGKSRLTGHNGSVVFASGTCSTLGGSQCLASCGEDHTVRVWELAFDQVSLESLGCAVTLLLEGEG